MYHPCGSGNAQFAWIEHGWYRRPRRTPLEFCTYAYRTNGQFVLGICHFEGKNLDVP